MFVNEKDKIASLIRVSSTTSSIFEYMTGKQWMDWVGEVFWFIKRKDCRTDENIINAMWYLGSGRTVQISGYSGGMKQRLRYCPSINKQSKGARLWMNHVSCPGSCRCRHEVLQMISTLKK